jgi:hypothetical protein
VHIFLNRLRTDHAKIGSNVIDQLFKSGRAIGRPDMKVSLARGDLMIVPNSANLAPKTAPSKLRGSEKSLTLSELNTNSRRWCCSSKGERRANTTAIAKVAMPVIVIAFTRTLRGKRCEKGVTSGTVRDNTTVTIDAMICSAGASAPMRPVYDLEYQIVYHKAEKIRTRARKESKEMRGTYKWDEHVKDDARHSRAAQKRHGHAQRVRPQTDKEATTIEERVQRKRAEKWHRTDKQKVRRSETEQLQRQRAERLHQKKGSEHVALIFRTDDVGNKNYL